MDILYKSKSVKQQFNPEYKKQWRYPDPVKTKLLALETFIQAADSLLDIKNYSPYRFHRLQGKRSNEWSISLGNTGYRVTVIPCDHNGNPLIRGDILSQCTSIKIIMVTEVSNHYE